MVNYQFRTARREQSEANESMVKAMPALTRIVTQATQSLSRPGKAPSPGITALFNAEQEAEQQQYITFAQGRLYLVSARPATEHAGQVVQRLRELVVQTEVEVPGVNVGVTGEPVLELDEMQQSQQDSTVATVVSLVMCALIFIYGYRETGRPLKATLCLVVGLGYTLGYTTLTIGHLNILTVTFLPMLIGLAIDFGVHLITRYEEELRNGLDQKEVARTGHGQHGPGNLHRLLYNGRGISRHGLHRLQRHSGDGHHHRRRHVDLPDPNDDFAAGSPLGTAARTSVDPHGRRRGRSPRTN